ncbi:autotransporter outer membrane beta-barrel domain-containing protein [Variovorax sp.]|uniref:autotransporter family protein n=2 Tax=Variovorax sp. TaxID=1871043 RepID=UPI00121C1CCF|nr:autotransporter outer membrane beta-barrel domain-containing protein [Variovorax sp.]TAJ64824.1 MAG: autotransporter outer membrane beta-barrel domain-containing protein [Variovorax sp.]
MNETFETIWTGTPHAGAPAPGTARGRGKTHGTVPGTALLRVAMASALACAAPAWAAGGAGGQPTDNLILHGGAGGATDGNGSVGGGRGALNDSALGSSAGDGGASAPGTGASAGSTADIGTFAGATAGTGGAAGSSSAIVSPGVSRGANGGAGDSRTGDANNGNGYGGGGGGGYRGNALAPNAAVAAGSNIGGDGGAGGNGYWAAGGGGAGAHGSTLLAPTANFTVLGTGISRGGVGGQGGAAYSQGGGGGGGGSGFFVSASTPGFALSNLGRLAGGAGGAGGPELLPARANASGGGGGEGGNGLMLAGAASSVSNAGAIVGGAGGAGGNAGGGVGGTGAPGQGGDGGAGLRSSAAQASIVNSATITGGAGGAGGASSNGGPRGANGAGGAGVVGANLALTSSGAIVGGLGGDGISRAASVRFTGGSNSLRLDTGASLMGALAIDSGASATVIAGADRLSLNAAVDLGGIGTIDTNGHDLAWSGPITGSGDFIKTGAGTLSVSGANTYAGGTDVRQGVLRTTATNALSAGSSHTVAAGATLDLAGFSQTVASLANGGTVSLVGAVPGTTLTVNGNYTGNNGVLRLGAVLDSPGISDRLVINGGTASGVTRVQVANLGGLGARTVGNGIEVVSAQAGATTTAQTTRDAFVLAGGHVDAGAYEYRLYAADASGAGENWYLRADAPNVATPGTPATPGAPIGAPVVAYRPQASLYAALPSQLRQGNLAMLGNLHLRRGDETAVSAAPEGTSARRAWGRLISADIDIRQGGTVSPGSKGRVTGLQAGTDLLAMGNWRAGLYVGQLEGDVSVDGFVSGVRNLRAGRNDLRSQYLGAYGTYAGDGGFYADVVLQGARHRADAASSLDPGAQTRGRSLLASLEIGQSLALGNGWSVEPQLQLIHQRLDLDSTAIAGAQVQSHADNGWTARAGVRVKGRVDTAAGALQPYARVNVYKRANGSDTARFVNAAAVTDITAPIGGTSTELAAGFTLALNESTSLHGELGKLWSSGGDARVRSSIGASVGVRVAW